MIKGNYTEESPTFTLDTPVTRQIIANETGMSYATIRRKLKKMDFVPAGNLICPLTYKRILVELRFIPFEDYSTTGEQ